MTTITRERLQEVIDGDILFTDEQRELARIALASLEAEPVCYLTWHQGFSAPDDCEEYFVEAKLGDKSCDGSPAFPVYAAPPAPVAVPECFKRLLHHAYGMTMGHDWNKGTMAGHHRAKLCQAVEECRAAMLQGKAEPVSNRDELPVSEIECDICGFKSTDPDGAHYCCEDNSND
ncbi:hypothetical protein ACO1Y9_09100 [Klebsiella quasipneumoniae]|uniref:hypothetical protein n=1 Tax=Klebsiella quasipneumoniae TaxID=1463165 RepID=UPI003BF7418A